MTWMRAQPAAVESLATEPAAMGPASPEPVATERS